MTTDRCWQKDEEGGRTRFLARGFIRKSLFIYNNYITGIIYLLLLMF